MDAKYIASILLVTALIVIFIYNEFELSEGFSNRSEKVSAIYNWFSSNPNPNYTKYKDDLQGQSNIVEYEDVLRLFKQKNLTVSSVNNVV